MSTVISASWITRHPRAAGAAAFGLSSALVIHFAWTPNARMTGSVPIWTVVASLAHAAIGAISGPRLFNRKQTKTSMQACWLGARVSLLALLLVLSLFAIWVASANAQPAGLMSSATLVFFVVVFSFFAIGWALVLVCAGVAWALFRSASATNS